MAPYGEDRFKEDLGPNPLLAKDNYIFGVQAVDSSGNGSSIVVPLPGRE